MNSITIRLAQKQDTKEIYSLFSILDTKDCIFSDKEYIGRYINKKQGCYVAVQNEVTIAAVLLKIEEKSCEIHLIASKKKGGGSALVNFIIDKCRRENIPKVWCRSFKQYKAEGFYKKMGFKESYLMKKQWYGKDCYFFGREIKK